MDKTGISKCCDNCTFVLRQGPHGKWLSCILTRNRVSASDVCGSHMKPFQLNMEPQESYGKSHIRVFFENGKLSPVEFLRFHVDHCCDAADGYASNVKMLDNLKKTDPGCAVYTNSLVALSNYYTWNEALCRPEVFMRASKCEEFRNIEELHGGKIRIGQNIEAMFKSGCFGCLY